MPIKASDFTPQRTVFVPTKEEYLAMYKLLLRTSLLNVALDERRNELPLKIFTSLGQEAISVGAVFAAQPEDWFAPSHRDIGVLLGRGFTVEELVCHAGAFAESLFEGYDFGPHIASHERHIVRFISDMAGNAAVGVGLIDAIYYIRDIVKKEEASADPALLAFFGDGAMSTSNAHSAFKLASTRNLPVLFILNNNCLSIRTPLEYQSKKHELARTAEGYGIESWTIFGNDVVLVWRHVKEALEQIRNGRGPHFIECQTFRDTGHHAHETGEMAGYAPKGLRSEWHGRNPLELYAHLLTKMKLLDETAAKNLKTEEEAIINAAFEKVKTYTSPRKLHKVFAPAPAVLTVHRDSQRQLSYGAAINEAMKQGLEMYPNLRIFGEDVETGGVHGITKGLSQLFGKERIFHMPLDENGIAAFAAGQALHGVIAVPEMQFFPFIKYAMGILTNFAGTNHAVTGEALPIVVRAPFGGGFESNHCHQECLEALFAHISGFKIVFPATSYAAKGLLLSAFADGNPVIFCEQISAYGKKGIVPEDPYLLPIGKANVLVEGEDITLISYGALMIARALKAAEALKESNVFAEVIDLQTVTPLDEETIILSVTKTGTVLVVHEAQKNFGIGAEVAATIREKTQNFLDIKVARLGAKQGAVPAHPSLEELRLPQVEDIVKTALEALK